MEIENPEAGHGKIKSQPLRGQRQEPAGEVGAEAGAGCGLERGLPPQGTGGACWNGPLVAKVRIGTSLVCRLRRKRGHLPEGAEKGQGLFRGGASVTEVRLARR